ncbi:MAG: Co2+/Mg2+ efflux protein ApaG [bacterium]|nr:Co2+/Mg2+ efflux protein ApaG [bacterium]
MSDPHSSTVTAGIRIHAAAQFLPQESEPENERFVYGYKITMTNESAPGKVRLVSRHWRIVDSEGRTETVRGSGVVGEYPELTIGESFSYVSYCPLSTKWGTMEGSYTFEREDGSRFEVAIGRFFLVPSAPELPLETHS